MAAETQQMLELVTYQTYAIGAQALVAVGTVIAAIWIGRMQSKHAVLMAKAQIETQYSLAAQQHEATLDLSRKQQETTVELSREQHERAVELSRQQHERTVDLMRAEWARADEQREAVENRQRDSMRKLLANFSSALEELHHSLANPATHSLDGLRIVLPGVVPLGTAIDKVKREGALSLRKMNEIGPVLSQTVTGVLATSLFKDAFTEAANAAGNVVYNYPAVVGTWAGNVQDKYQEAWHLI